MENAWFVPASRIEQYTVAERVHDLDEQGRRTLRKYPRDTFIYRLAGRDRQKSASYYTPQVLTRCLVKYALKELLKDKTADEILPPPSASPPWAAPRSSTKPSTSSPRPTWSASRPSWKCRIPHEQYATELQKVRMFIADRNAFGVDLNPIATELAEVSLWLNAIYGEPTEEGKPPRPARVPWFGYQLFTGNSLIGSRREVYPAALLRGKKAAPGTTPPPAARSSNARSAAKPTRSITSSCRTPAWRTTPTRWPTSSTRTTSSGSRAWRKDFTQPLEEHEVQRLLQLSTAIDALWAEHAKLMAEDRAHTEDPLAIWPAKEPTAEPAAPARKRRKSAPSTCSIRTTTSPRPTAASSW